VDVETKINAFMTLLDGIMGGGLVTLEKVRVIHYRHESGSHQRETTPP
jgi:PII-like signaling protein